MKVGIMQPYYFPYIGYWQLINAVDTWVVYDDVNFIKGGWINRNRVLIGNQIKYFNVQLSKASPFKLINEIEISDNISVINKNLRFLESAYGKAPYYNTVYSMIKDIITYSEKNLAHYLLYSINRINEYLDINTQIVLSSSLNKDNLLKGQEKIISICESLGATEYYNAIGGRELYSSEIFKQHNIELHFLESDKIEYKQFDGTFYSNLSIIDVMMFNPVGQIKEFLKNYLLS